MPRLIQVIQSEICRGKGTEESRMRIVVQYHTIDGDFLAESDPELPGWNITTDQINHQLNGC